MPLPMLIFSSGQGLLPDELPLSDPLFPAWRHGLVDFLDDPPGCLKLHFAGSLWPMLPLR
jgi:hypothetical protein